MESSSQAPLKNVGEPAAGFGVPGMKEICRRVGWWHDLGKYRAAFQKYLRGEIPSSHNTNHSAYGAALAAEFGLSSGRWRMGYQSVWLFYMLQDTQQIIAEGLYNFQRAFEVLKSPIFYR